MSTVSYGAIKLELRRARLRDGLLREQIIRKLQAHYQTPGDGETGTGLDGLPMTYFYRIFGRVCSQTEQAENLPFRLVKADDSAETMVAEWEKFIDMDEDFLVPCMNAINELLEPLDAATGPNPLPEGAEKNS